MSQAMVLAVWGFIKISKGVYKNFKTVGNIRIVTVSPGQAIKNPLLIFKFNQNNRHHYEAMQNKPYKLL